jgi:ABC-type antimicrobial peptide transport system permease subunit
VIRLVLGSASKPIAVGLVAGLGLAMAASYVIAQGTKGAPLPLSTSDPVAYLMAALLLAMTTAIAVMGPARRAASADPVRALRHE